MLKMGEQKLFPEGTNRLNIGSFFIECFFNNDVSNNLLRTKL